jgi:hypothetical protein
MFFLLKKIADLAVFYQLCMEFEDRGLKIEDYTNDD